LRPLFFRAAFRVDNSPFFFFFRSRNQKTESPIRLPPFTAPAGTWRLRSISKSITTVEVSRISIMG
jgi:hypothetical protein